MLFPACLRLSLQPHVLQPRYRADSSQQQRQAQCAAAYGGPSPATTSRPPGGATRSRDQGGGAHMRPRLAHFDAALQAGRLDAALALLREAAALARGAPVPLLAPNRNRAYLHACFASGRPDAAVEYLRLLHPRVAPWPAVMQEASRRRDVPTLQRVLAAQHAAGLPLDGRSVTAAISGYAAGGRHSEALATFRRAWERPDCRTVHVANAAISACAAPASWAAAQEVAVLMAREGVAPDVVTYNSLLKVAAAAALMPEARRLYAQLRSAGLRPTTFTYAALFNAAARSQHGDAAWLLKTFDEMAEAGVQPNGYVVSALFSAASHAPCTPAQLDRLFGVLALLRSHSPPNDTVYSSVLTLIQRQGIQERAVDVWTAATQDGARLTPHLFSSLFAACAAPGASLALRELALEAADALQAAWLAAPRKGPAARRYQGDMLVAYNALLHCLGCVGDLQRSLAVYGGMRRDGPPPDVVTYNTLIAAAAWRGSVAAAMRIFSDMVDADIEPTERTAGALLNCYAKAGDAASAARVFEGMAALGISPNLEMYTSLIDACVQAPDGKWVKTAFELLEQMRGRGLRPSAVTYGCLLSACDKRGDVTRAFSLYQQACDEGVVPSDQMHDMLISMCTEAERLEEAVDLVKRLARPPPSSPSASGVTGGGTVGAGPGGPGGTATTASGLHEHTLNSLIRALCGKYVDRALRLLSLCQTMGLRPSRRTYLSLISGCAKASRSQAAYDLYRSLRAQGMDADGPAGSALIVSLCKANQLDVAETVYNDMLAQAWRHEHTTLPAPAARRGGLASRARIPDADALAALVQAFASAQDLRAAAKYYKQLRRAGRSALAAAAVSQRRMWEVLIENYCRQHSVKQALQVFDDWKAARDEWLAQQQHQQPYIDGADGELAHLAAPAADPGAAGTSKQWAAGGAMQQQGAVPANAAALVPSQQQPQQQQPQQQQQRFPKLSTVSLAFLEACCRSEAAHSWRVYDVCAVMRQQKELKTQAGLARPQKRSHHFAPV